MSGHNLRTTINLTLSRNKIPDYFELYSCVSGPELRINVDCTVINLPGEHTCNSRIPMSKQKLSYVWFKYSSHLHGWVGLC